MHLTMLNIHTGKMIKVVKYLRDVSAPDRGAKARKPQLYEVS